MIELVTEYLVPYINNLKPIEPKLDPDKLNVRYEDIRDKEFDIIDDKEKAVICVRKNSGGATYHNLKERSIKFIDYEDIINQFPLRLQNGIKRCDFIAYDYEGNSFFILNELSQSAKLKDAIEQLYSTALRLTRVEQIKIFINSKENRQCIFSNRSSKDASTPFGMADSFILIQKILPEPIIHSNHRINQLGFELIETDHIYIK